MHLLYTYSGTALHDIQVKYIIVCMQFSRFHAEVKEALPAAASNYSERVNEDDNDWRGFRENLKQHLEEELNNMEVSFDKDMETYFNENLSPFEGMHAHICYILWLHIVQWNETVTNMYLLTNIGK